MTFSERDSIAQAISSGFVEAERGQLIDDDVAVNTLGIAIPNAEAQAAANSVNQQVAVATRKQDPE